MKTQFVPYVVLLLVALGCRPAGLDTVYVEGTVLYDGKPLEKALVVFHPTDSDGIGASGLTDASGVFRLTSLRGGDPNKGALAGEYAVTISRNKDEPTRYRDEPTAEGMEKVPVFDSLIKKRYNKADTSGLTATVGPGENRFSFTVD